MGFRAKSAEEVYRYAFRLDGRPKALTDRFCLSLIFVNDSSPVCREFLSRHFVDLCHRTADRIRFVFFADLDPSATDWLERSMAHQLYGPGRERDEPVRGGFLAGLLRSFIGSFNPTRKPHPSARPQRPWQALQPPELIPVASPEDTFQLLGYDKDTGSAVRGVGEALRFAQRLGIGAQVPCILLVTDVGSLGAELLPMAGLTADEVYLRVRGWVDDFYARNQRLFSHWEDVERQIESLQEQARLSLSQVRAWRDRAVGPSRQLVALAERMRLVASLPAGDNRGWPEALGRAVWDLSSEARALLQRAHAEQRALSRPHPMARWLSDLRTRLEVEQRSPSALEKLLHSVSPSALGKLPSSVVAMISEHTGRAAAPPTDLPDHPARGVVTWWRERPASSVPVTPGDYYQAADGWSCVPAELRRRGDRDFFQVVLPALRAAARQTAAEPRLAVDEALRKLAERFGKDPADAEWNEQTAAYRARLIDGLAGGAGVPPELGATPYAALLEGPPDDDCPGVDELLARLDRGSLSEKHPIIRLVALNPNLDFEVGRRQAQSADIAENIWAALLEGTRRAIRELAPPPADWELLRGELLSGLGGVRFKLQAEIERLESELVRGSAPHPGIAPERLRELHSLLDEYDRVVGQIVYPHRDDPDVIRIALLVSAPQAAGLGRDTLLQADGPLTARQMLEEVARTEAETQRQWSEVPTLPLRVAPAAKLSQAILQRVSAGRIEAILPPGQGDLGQRLRAALVEQLVRQTLGGLDIPELAAILAALSDPEQKAVTLSRDGFIDLILTRAGADPVPPLVGQETLGRMLADLEARLDSLDDQGVIYWGVELRRQLEQYLKQFLVAYARLGLSTQERAELLDSTLGALAGYVIRLLSRPAVSDDLGSTDGPRLAEQCRRVREASALRPGWLDSLKHLLGEIPSLTNPFPHHVIREGRQMPPAELRHTLGRLLNAASELVRLFQQAELYPICLRFLSVRRDSTYHCRFEFECDPPLGGKELIAFSQIPPQIPGLSGDLFWQLYRRVLLMLPLAGREPVDPDVTPFAPA